MELTAATRLIEKGIDSRLPGQQWADLGAGHGLFTKALALLLGKEGRVYAVDKNAGALKGLDRYNEGAGITIIAKDFQSLAFDSLDGVIIANALHYVADQQAMLERIRQMLKPSGRLLVIEYDIHRANRWVPYPVAFSALEKMAGSHAWSVEKLATQPSAYQGEGMYSAILYPQSPG